MNTPKLDIVPEYLKLISEIDEFKGRWAGRMAVPPASLNDLRRAATIRAIGASTRIQGSGLSDEEVGKVAPFSAAGSDGVSKGHDWEAVAGYAEAMEAVIESWEHVDVSERHLKQLHKLLSKHSPPDKRHKGDYKKMPNHIEAFDSRGKSLGVVVKTVSPVETPARVAELLDWYREETEKGRLHALLRIAVFIVRFLAIAPFQDGNGRLSRLMTTIMLLKAGYAYVLYYPLDKIVEERKDQYYLALRSAHRSASGEDKGLKAWVTFFLRALKEQVVRLEREISGSLVPEDLPPLSQKLALLARQEGKMTVRDAQKATGANRNTIKLHLGSLVKRGVLLRKGVGKGSWYVAA